MSNKPQPKTPPPKGGAPLPPDTPPIIRDTSQALYRAGGLSQGRQAVLSDLQRVLTVPFDLLRKRIVQDDTLGKDHIAQIRKHLEKEGKLIVSESEQVYWEGLETSPASSKESESKTFAHLTPIINSIFRQQSSCVVDYVDNPNRTPLSSRNNTSRPDAYIKLCTTKNVESTSGSTRHHWFDLAVPFEFKLRNHPDNDALDNEHKIIWSLHNIMREDPCRRFAYGITIEDKYMRLWLTNRACFVVTEPINFMEDIDDSIFLFSALGSATDVALGWDPTIERIFDTENKNPTQYRIKVNETVYTTTDEIATFGADSLVGRGTRVYKAKDAQGNVVAIKDSWKDSDRPAEGDIIAEILQAIRAKFPTEAEEVTKYFVSVRDFGDVIVHDSVDRTVAFTKDGALPEGCRWEPVRLTAAPSTRSHIPSAGNVPVVAIQTLRPLLDSPIPQKVHHRIVFHDVGTALQDMLTLKDIIACLRDTLKALYYMHRVGWIHRDYSAGNALRVFKDGQGIGKLSDFEYAKSTNWETSHDVRTGTFNFMAWEVDRYSYLFLPPIAFPEPDPDMQDTSPTEAPSAPFRMNFLHDLESVFWVFSWALFCNTDKRAPAPDLQAQCIQHNKAFPGFPGLASRQDFLTRPEVSSQALKTLSPSCYKAAVPIYRFARDLVAAYQRAEASYPNISIPDDHLEDIHDKSRTHLDTAWAHSGGVDLVRVHALYEQSHKRPIAEAETSSTQPAPKKKR